MSNIKKVRLPNVPKSLDRDTTVFLQSVRQAISELANTYKDDTTKASKALLFHIRDQIDQVVPGKIDGKLTVENILDLLNGKLNEMQLSKDMADRIALIDTNRTAIELESIARAQDIIQASKELNAEQLARIQDIKDVNDALVLERQERAQEIVDATTAIADERRDRVESLRLEALARQDDMLEESQARLLGDSTLNTALVNEVDERKLEQGYLISDINGIYAQVNPDMAGDDDRWAGDDEYFAGVWTERSAIIELGLATSDKLDVVTSNINDNKATITQYNKTMVTKTEVLAQQTNTLSAQMVGGYQGNNLDDVTSGLIHQERRARATDVEGLAEQISLITAGVGEQFDSYQIWHFNKNKDGWTGGSYSNGYIKVDGTGILTSPDIQEVDDIPFDPTVYRHLKMRVERVGSPTWSGVVTWSGGTKTIEEPTFADNITTISFNTEWSGAISAFSVQLAASASTSNYYKVDWIAVGRPSPGASHAALLREESARASKDLALAQDITSLNAQINGGPGVSSDASIVGKLTTLATNTGAEAEKLEGLTASFNNEVLGSEGVVANNARAAADATSAVASDLSGVFAQVNPRMAGDTDRWAGEDDPLNGVGVWSERSARMESDFAEAQKMDVMSARIDNNQADISQVNSLVITKNEVVAKQVNSLSAQMTGGSDSNDINNLSSGLIYQEREARATKDSALASEISLLSASLGDEFDSYETWTFDSGKDGWAGGSYSNGYILPGNNTVTSPSISKLDNKSFDTSVYRRVKIRIERVGEPLWDAIFSWGGGSKVMPEPKFSSENIATIDMGVDWSGVVDKVSVKLSKTATASHYYKIDWVAIGRPAPGASNASVMRESFARVARDNAIAGEVQTLNAQINGGPGVSTEASIVKKLEVTTGVSDAAASDLKTLSSKFNNEVLGSEGIVARNAQTAASATSAVARDLDGVFAQVNPRMAGDTDRWAGDNDPLNGVGIWSERSAQMESDLAEAIKFDAMQTRLDSNEAAINTERVVRTTQFESLAQETKVFKAEFEDNKGVVQSAITAAAGPNSALAKSVDTLQTTVGDNTASIETQQKVVDGLNAQWSVKADVNGLVGGVGFVNDGNTVDFIVRASTFAVQGPGGSKGSPFMVYPNGQWIGGVWVEPGVYIDTAFIRRGSFDSLSSLSAKIGHFKSANSGARLEIEDGLLTVYDSNNKLRVKLGVW